MSCSFSPAKMSSTVYEPFCGEVLFMGILPLLLGWHRCGGGMSSPAFYPALHQAVSAHGFLVNGPGTFRVVRGDSNFAEPPGEFKPGVVICMFIEKCQHVFGQQ